jgi:hypothetical protein
MSRDDLGVSWRLLMTSAVAVSFLLVSHGGSAQTAAPPPAWAGWARCQVDVVARVIRTAELTRGRSPVGAAH